MRNALKLAIGVGVLALCVVGLLRWRSAASADHPPVTMDRGGKSGPGLPQPPKLARAQWVQSSIAFGTASNDAGPPPPALAGYDDRPLVTASARKAIVEEIAASGRNHSAWSQQAARVFSEIKGGLPQEISEQIEIRNSECFESACITDVVYADAAAYDGSAALFWSNAKLIGWPGVKGRTPPETLESGKLLISWLLFNPED